MEKNPRRVAAGKLNRAKRPPLSDDARERLREAARDHRPWLHATGPRTVAGKAKSAVNAKNRHVASRATATKPTSASLASVLLRQATQARKGLYLDPATLTLRSTGELVDQVQQLASEATRATTHDSARKLTEHAEANTATLVDACREAAAERLALKQPA